jgi:hypothetical protein
VLIKVPDSLCQPKIEGLQLWNILMNDHEFQKMDVSSIDKTVLESTPTQENLENLWYLPGWLGNPIANGSSSFKRGRNFTQNETLRLNILNVAFKATIVCTPLKKFAFP